MITTPLPPRARNADGGPASGRSGTWPPPAILLCAGTFLLTSLVAPPAAPHRREAAPEAPGVQAPIDRVDALVQSEGCEGASRWARETLAEAERSHGPDSIQSAAALDALSRCGWRGCAGVSPERAREAARRAADIKERLLGPNDLELAVSLNLLANLTWKAGEYSASTPLYLRALQIRERALGAHHILVAKSLSNLGTQLLNLGDFAEGRRLLERSLGILEGLTESYLFERAVVMTNLGGVLLATGDYPAARRNYERALEIQERLGAEDQVAGALSALGEVDRLMGEYGDAARLLDRALEIQVRLRGPSHAAVAEALADLAALRAETGDAAGAESLYARALEVAQRSMPPMHPRLASILASVAEIRTAKGEYAEAGPLLERARSIQEAVLGPLHPELATTLNDQARLAWFTGDVEQALRGSLRAEAITRTHFRTTAPSLSEREAIQYETLRASGADIAFSALGLTGRDAPPPEAVEQVYDELIRSRAMLLDEMASRHRASRAGGDETAPLEKDLLLASNRLLRILLSPADRASAATYRDDVQRALQAKERAERALADRSTRFRGEVKRGLIGLQDVRDALPAGAAIVSYVQYRRLGARVGDRDENRYMAFVVGAADRGTVVVQLPPVDQVDALIRRWRLSVGTDPRAPGSGSSEGDYRAAARPIREAIWDPVARHLSGARLVFVVPDGAINLVSLATLPDDDGRYLVETGPLLHYLSTERDLARDRPDAGAGEGLLAFGGPDFDARGDRAGIPASLPATSAPPALAVTGPGPPRSRGLQPSCGSFSLVRFEPLPGSGAEAEEVASLWTAHAVSTAGRHPEAQVLTGSGATESAFKAKAPGRAVLHVATHGFFLQAGCGSPPAVGAARASTGMGERGGLSPRAGDDPLSLTGLAFAGANRHEAIDPRGEVEDGILTAEEIASLDLSGVRWVVLSACATGVGPVLSGEGVLGLRRAFEVAGASTLIMSLWEVEDEATRVWMRGLYESRLAGLSTALAVRKASLDILLSQRRRGATTHPFYWGAFLAAGDWR